MGLLASQLRGSLRAAARHTTPAAGTSAIAKAYADYASLAQCCAGGDVITVDFPARQRALQVALTATSANPQCGPYFALRAMANAYAAFWMVTPAVFAGGGVATVASADTLYVALVSQYLPQAVVAAAGGTPSGHEALAGVLDAWTRTVVATVAALPCTGPLV